MAATNEEYITASTFKVNIEGMQAQNFDTVDGIGVAFEDIAQQAEKENGMVNRPGRFTASDVTLTRRFKKDKEFHEWVKSLKQGKKVRRSGSIIVMDDEQKEVFRYNFTGAWPKHWSGPTLSKNREGNGILLERIVLSVQDIEMA
ncbi:MAG: phage tail protein [Deltaproteobacteria bacterium]|nr:phage tail protein [Deltaproteobacteria bacterium]